METPRYLREKMEIDNQGTIVTSVPRLKQTSLTFRWRTIQTWNEMSTDIRTEMSLPAFKRATKRWILELRTQPNGPGEPLRDQD